MVAIIGQCQTKRKTCYLFKSPKRFISYALDEISSYFAAEEISETERIARTHMY